MAVAAGSAAEELPVTGRHDNRNRFTRAFRHAGTGVGAVRRALPDAALTRIEERIAAGEAQHSGEIRFVVEASLDSRRVWARTTPRERALELFAQLHVWDTDQNNGLLLYVLLADRAVELIADRALTAVIGDAQWLALCAELTSAYRQGQYLEGTLKAIDAIHALLRPHFPPRESNPNELPDRPLVL